MAERNWSWYYHKCSYVLSGAVIAALVLFTIYMLKVNPPVLPDAAALGGEESQAYLDAMAVYQGGVDHIRVTLTLSLLVVVCFFFFLEIVPIAFVALVIPCYFSLTGLLTFGEAFSGFVDSSVMIYGGMFLVGGAMFRTGLAQKVGIKVVMLARGSKTRTILGVCLVTATLSAFLSNTGTVAVLLPVCLGIADSQGWNRGDLLFPLAMMASAGGMITLVGTPPNMSAWTTLNGVGVDIGFFEFAKVGLPLAAMTIVYCLTIGRKLVTPRASSEVVESQEDLSNRPVRKQWVVGIILVAVIVIMATELIPLATAAVLAGILCVFTGCLTEHEAYEAIDWEAIFLFAGALGLANAMKITGAGAVLADGVVGIIGAEPHPMVLMIALFLLAGVLTQFMSNTAAAALLCPIGLSIAQSVNANPIAVVLAIGFACSAAYVTPIATPPNTMCYGPGGMHFLDFVKYGLPLFLISGVLICVLLPLFFPFY